MSVDHVEQVEPRPGQTSFPFADMPYPQAEAFYPELLGRYKAIHNR